MVGSRKFAGRRIKRARVAAGYKSQKAFADAIGVSENSVAHAETGSERIGDTVFGAIEAGLRWPEDCISQYLETGDESLLPSRAATTPPRNGSHTPADHYPSDLRDDPVERKLWDIEELDDASKWRHIYAYRTEADIARRIVALQPTSEPNSGTTHQEQSG